MSRAGLLYSQHVATDNGEDARTRFSNRVWYYIRYRPRYPVELIPYLSQHCGLAPSNVLADVGSGTGFLAELFLRNGNAVFGIEPNQEMRLAGEKYLRQYSQFYSINGTAEVTTLPDASCHHVSAGQAFHWFDIPRARVEFRRVLKPEGQVFLLWNDRRTDTPFLHDYEDLLREYGTDYSKVDHRNIGPEELARFFGTKDYLSYAIDAQESVDYAALEGRLLSASYIPLPDHPRFAATIQALKALFVRHAVGGKVTFLYRTLLYAGTLR